MKIFTFLFIIINILSAATYYVDKDGVHGTVGDDNNSGLSWNDPWATITKAAQVLTAGDSVIVANAVYRERIQPLNSGSSSAPIVYYTDEKAEIAGSEIIDESQFTLVSGYNHVFQTPFPDFEVKGVVQLAGSDSVVLRPYLDTTSSISSVEANPGSFWYDDNSNILYVHTADGQPPDSLIHNIEVVKRQYGLYLDSKDHIQIKGFIIRSQSARGSAGFGVYIYNCRNIELVADTIIGAVLRGYQSNNLHIENCSINRLWRLSTPFNYHMLPHGISGLSLAACDTVLIKGVEIWWQTDAAALSGDCESVVIEDSRWYGCPNHGFKLDGNGATGRPNNIIFRRCEAGQQCQEAIKFWYNDNVLIENCDLTFLNHTYGEDSSYHSTNIKVRNTLFTHTYPPDHRNMNIWIGEFFYVNEYDMDYNCVYNPEYPSRFIAVGKPTSTKMTLSEWQSFSGQDLHSICTEPYVISAYPGPGHPESNFFLTDSSPCIDAGDPTYPVPPNGGQYIDIGAYEFEQTSAEEYDNTYIQYIRIYPNPFRGKISVEIPDLVPGEDHAHLQIVDVSGKVIFSSTTDQAETTITFPAGHADGVYFLLIKDDEQNMAQKIILVK
ncbi:MAG TPA: T9SS type A sorting domain-containing protein [candidate division WOR-3 bacterium]|uniref:T9SS type A sorting domain-containing protein n=1 Tax=candidate division WOR-3 bacterium TaxID=2052148 RepID=A0A9C9EKS3_UNCW3|nr:T9SS type A sorting domain-containing protein [candidate division WOR-3 bacterium]